MDVSADNIVLITGGGGFLGAQLGIALLKSDISIKELVLTDIVEPRPLFEFENDARVVKIKADLSDSVQVDRLFEKRTYTAIAALHGLMSGGSEADFELGMKANLDSTRFLLEKIRLSNLSKPPVFLYTSSGGVYGGEIKDNIVTDDTTPTPQGSYGMQKMICEHLCFDYSRRGWIDTRIVRLPTVTVRPGAPNTALTSYASNIVREPLKGQKAVCPVSMDTKLFICSPAIIIHNFVHLMKLDGSKYPKWTRTTALPGIEVSTQDIIDAVEQVGGKKAVDLIEHNTDERVNWFLKTIPSLWITDRAMRLGCKRDENVLDIVKQYKVMLDAGQG